MSQRTYRINVVSEMTGVPSATLRAWERRYGFPKPDRTGSRYRVYSDQDIALVRRMKEMVTSGMAASDSARLLIREPVEAAPRTPEEDPFATTAARMVTAAHSMDVQGLEAEVRVALTLGDAVEIVERCFAVAMRGIGDAWEAGTLSIAHEHLASEVITLATRDLMRLIPMGRSHHTAVLACFAEEQHVMPLYSAAFRFIDEGVRPDILGLRTPPEAIAEAVRERAPDVVGLSVTVKPDPRKLEGLLSAYAEAAGKRPWLVGGSSAVAIAEQVKAAGGIPIVGDKAGLTKALDKALKR